MDNDPQIQVIDFGSQYTQLIVRRLRECGYFAKLYNPNDLKSCSPKGIILSGGPRSVSDPDSPDIDLEYLESLDIPILGICYGMQLLNKKNGGVVEPGETREYGPASLKPCNDSGLFNGLSESSQIWMSHSDTCTKLPDGAKIIGTNENDVPVAIQISEKIFVILINKILYDHNLKLYH